PGAPTRWPGSAIPSWPQTPRTFGGSRSRSGSAGGPGRRPYFRWVQHTDVRQVLSSIRAPTLVLHRKDMQPVTFDHGRYLAVHIPGARFVPLDGVNLSIYAGPGTQLDHIEAFIRRFAGPVH